MSEPVYSITLTRNNEGTVESCLESAIAGGCTPIVVDTGSTDSTIEKAEAMGAQVVRQRWMADFAAHRNRGLLEVPEGAWVLMLDSDEFLSRSLHPKRWPDAPAFRVKVMSTSEDKRVASTFGMRLFRNIPGVHYRRTIHEQLYLGTQLLDGDDVGIAIFHSGYSTPELRARKLQRNRDMLIRWLAYNTDDDAMNLLERTFLRIAADRELERRK